MDINKLKAKLVERQISVEKLACILGISYATLHRRFNNPATFTVGEVADLITKLNLNIKDVNSIFFNL